MAFLINVLEVYLHTFLGSAYLPLPALYETSGMESRVTEGNGIRRCEINPLPSRSDPIQSYAKKVILHWLLHWSCILEGWVLRISVVFILFRWRDRERERERERKEKRNEEQKKKNMYMYCIVQYKIVIYYIHTYIFKSSLIHFILTVFYTFKSKHQLEKNQSN